MVKKLVQKWSRPFRDRMGLDVLLVKAPPPSAPLRERLGWMGHLIHWVRTPTLSVSKLADGSTGKLQVARLRYVLQILEQNPALKEQVGKSLRSIILDTRALELFMNVGIPNQQGFIGELFERLNLRLLPQPPRDRDLISIFSETFRFKNDPRWIRNMNPEQFRAWMDLIRGTDANWDSLVQDIRDAIYLLGQSVSSIGLSRLVRNRVDVDDFRRLPFYEIPAKVEELLQAKHDSTRAAAYRELRAALARCSETLRQVYAHFRTQGVSIALVYQVEQLRAMMRRLDTLACLLVTHREDPVFIQDFLATLVEENYRALRIRGLFNDNIVLVCHKIVETNAETGEHYISRNREEHFDILKSAAGGGVVTAFTTLFKMLLHYLDLAPFLWGLSASVNYALSFVALHLFGFTLATKQPAMTATALAEKLETANRGLDPLIDEIIHLLRSQIATVIGNVMTVIAAVGAIHGAFVLLGRQLVDTTYARQTIESFSILGWTPFYAAWTGFLLWASSVLSGLFANWFLFRGLPEAIEYHPRLIHVFGGHRTRKWAELLRRNVSGVASSVVLGFLLGMSTPIGKFFGLPLDIRHVTLSTGTMAACCFSLGSAIFSDRSFWLALGGLFSMAVLNLAVSFSLALIVAIWAKQTTAPSLSVTAKALAKRLGSNPWVLFFPPSEEKALPEEGTEPRLELH